MAYNNYYPTQYFPQTTAPTQPQSEMRWVQGEAGAKSYLVAPNQTVTLWDSESQTIYLKTADAMGMPSMRILDYTVRENAPKIEKITANNDYATKNDVESLHKEIEALKAKFEEVQI